MLARGRASRAAARRIPSRKRSRAERTAVPKLRENTVAVRRSRARAEILADGGMLVCQGKGEDGKYRFILARGDKLLLFTWDSTRYVLQSVWSTVELSAAGVTVR